MNDVAPIQSHITFGMQERQVGFFRRFVRRRSAQGEARQGIVADEAAGAWLPVRMYGYMQSWLSMLPRDPWMWTHLVVVNIVSRFSGD